MNITEMIDQAFMNAPPKIGLAARQEPVGFRPSTERRQLWPFMTDVPIAQVIAATTAELKALS